MSSDKFGGRETMTVEWAAQNLSPYALVRFAEYPAAENLGAAASQIEALRSSLLFDSDALNTGLAPMASEHALVSLALLEQALRHMRMAEYEQARALAGGS